jgi:phosphoribosylanthranilate isomerase
MPRIDAKICGLTTPETLDAAVAGGASHVGFVFFAKSPRNLDPERLASLVARLPARTQAVGVFVDPDDDLLARVSPHLAVLQLHGKETPAQAAQLKQRFGREVWKAIPVRTRADLEQARAYRGAVDRILYDAKTPDGAAMPGGMGLRFDWTLLDGFAHPLPWVLSGGLDRDNVTDAVATTNATLVDVSSGVESAPGVKNVDKVRAFCQAVAQL